MNAMKFLNMMCIIIFGVMLQNVEAKSTIAMLYETLFASPEAEAPVEKLEIIGAGYGRTGTKSLKEALNILGFKAYHMDQVMPFKHEQMVIDAYTKGPKEIDIWFKDIIKHGFKATTDFPTCSMYKEQMKMFPDAKVILTTRDEAKWVKSLQSIMHLAAMTSAVPFKWFLDIWPFMEESFHNPNSKYAIGECRPVITKMYEPWYFPWISYPLELSINATSCAKKFRSHNEEVRKYVPKDKLLDIEISQGWKPLCEFLNVSAPNIPFPTSEGNKGSSRQEQAEVLVFIAKFYPFIILALLTIISALIVTLVKFAPKVIALMPKRKID